MSERRGRFQHSVTLSERRPEGPKRVEGSPSSQHRPHFRGSFYEGGCQEHTFPCLGVVGSDIRVPRLPLSRAVRGPVKDLCDSTLFNTVCCLLRHNASSFCERRILRLRKPCADHASIWGSRPIAISGRARGHSLRPGPCWPRIPLILSLDLFLPHCLPHNLGRFDRSVTGVTV